MRGIFFSEDDARTVALSLSRGGFTTEVVRERLAGEDDDEDHPWAVLTDAPEVVLELLVDTYDGWLDLEDAEGGLEARTRAPQPPELPEEPRRIRRTDGG